MVIPYSSVAAMKEKLEPIHREIHFGQCEHSFVPGAGVKAPLILTNVTYSKLYDVGSAFFTSAIGIPHAVSVKRFLKKICFFMYAL